QIDPAGLGNVVATYGAGGALTAHYTYGFGLISQIGATGMAAYYDFNNIGSTVGLTGSSGTYVNEHEYVSFGQTITIVSGVSNPFTFVGQFGVENDGSGLQDMRARDYDSNTGQFVSDDPLNLAGGETNLRIYVSNQPIDEVDATGLFTWGNHVTL